MKKLFVSWKYSIVLSVLLLNYSAFSQPQKPLPDNIPVISSPQVWSFMKYGNMSSVDMYTGTVATSIPIYTYKDNDFEIPVSVNYASSGFIPNVPTGILGLGWFLNAGGCITREVRGVPDEKQTPVVFDDETNSSVLYDGYLSYHVTYKDFPGWSSVISDNYNELRNPMLGFSINGKRIETLSDIYHFRFGNHKGTFCFGPNHEVYVYNTDRPFGEYKINYKIGGVTDAPASVGILQIDITTGDGYTYTFDGQIGETADREVGYSEISNATDGTVMQNEYICKSLFLKKISSPNGRFVKFEYNPARYITSVRPYSYKEYDSQDTRAKGYMDIYSTINAANLLIRSRYLSMDLAQININDQVYIQFKYKEKDWDIFESNGSTNYIDSQNKDLLLSDVQICSTENGVPIKKWTFNHKICYNRNDNVSTLLKSIKNDDGSIYEFSYYNEDDRTFPYHGTTAVDHWGYYNDVEGASLSNFIPQLEIDDFTYIERIKTGETDFRRPEMDKALFGMLQKVTYPTGGYTEYKYEGHTYSKYVGFDNEGKPTLIDNGVIYEAGGLRVVEIKDYAPGSAALTKTYKYEDNGSSNGILLYYPRYFLSYSLKIREDPQKITYKNYGKLSSTDIYATNIEKYHIGYSKVVESLADGSFTEYYFNDYVDFPDTVDSILYNVPYMDVLSISPEFINTYLQQPISLQSRRGKLKGMEMYSNDSVPVRKVNYKYLDTEINKYAEGLDVLCTKYYVVKRRVGNFPLIQETQINYYDHDSIVVNTSYEYNKLGQQTKCEVSLHNQWSNISKGERTFYPSDFILANSETTNDSALDEMISRNIVNVPIVEISTMNKFGDNYVVDIYRRNYIYNQNGNVNYPILSSVLTWNPSNTERFDDNKNYYNDGNYDNSYKKLITCDVYDKYGNIIQTTSQDNIKTVYIWGYNGLYPIAVIENSNLDAIRSISGFADIETTPLAAGLNEEQETRLRQIPNALITTYSYKPLVGITSITDSSGRRRIYDYDSSGRLISIKDENGNILENYDYSYNK